MKDILLPNFSKNLVKIFFFFLAQFTSHKYQIEESYYISQIDLLQPKYKYTKIHKIYIIN